MKKGFTLIELLAVIVLLGIVITIAIPGVNAVIMSSRKGTYVSEVKMMADSTSKLFIDGTFNYPSIDSAVLVRWDSIEKERGGKKSTFGIEWDIAYFIVYNNNGKLEYYFTGRDEDGNGNDLTEVEFLTKASVINNLSSITVLSVGDNSGIPNANNVLISEVI